MKIKESMTPRPITLLKNHTLNDALKIMKQQGIRECPVVSNNRLVGIITESDITKAVDVHNKINKIDDLPLVLLNAIAGNYNGMKIEMKNALNKKVHEIMTKDLVTISEDEDLYKAMKLINKHDIRSLPVMKGKKLTGIISRTDVIRKLSEN
ncbi:MAG: CBS domain-containing protein [Candidatus Aenigmarchaeota archaeon]|nr:CBS domain-containing protein [Candidatus Aenigmarchaeota archaeon]